jgi:HAD superfamily phosphoserine phosphatase-like hydrolase
MPRAFLCDFDGTVSPEDIGAALVRHFSPGREADRDALLARWRSGDMGHRALTEAECALVSARESDALAFVRRFRLDPAFAPFVREALGRGDAVMVVSEGFDFYVRDQLARAGLGQLPWAANHVRFEDARLHPEFPFADGGCGACGNCKAQHVRRYRAQGFHTILVGDGYSDRCGARAADEVLARGGLLAWCRDEGVPAESFGSFADVADWARRRGTPESLRPAPRGHAAGPS